MLHIPKIDDYLKIFTDAEGKDSAAINFGEYFISTKEKLYSKLNEEQNIKKAARMLHIFLAKPDEVEKYAKMIQSNSFDICVNR